MEQKTIWLGDHLGGKLHIRKDPCFPGQLVFSFTSLDVEFMIAAPIPATLDPASIKSMIEEFNKHYLKFLVTSRDKDDTLN